MAEGVLHLRGEWHTGFVREASFYLGLSTQRALEGVVPAIERLDNQLDPFSATDQVRKTTSSDKLPASLRNKWDRDETWVYRFLNSMSSENTPGRVDRSLQEKMDEIPTFASTSEALQFFYLTGRRVNFLLKSLGDHIDDSVSLAKLAYIESRVLRRAMDGQFLARPGIFGPVDHP